MTKERLAELKMGATSEVEQNKEEVAETEE